MLKLSYNYVLCIIYYILLIISLICIHISKSSNGKYKVR